MCASVPPKAQLSAELTKIGSYPLDSDERAFSGVGLLLAVLELDAFRAIINSQAAGDGISEWFAASNVVVAVKKELAEGQDSNDHRHASFVARVCFRFTVQCWDRTAFSLTGSQSSHTIRLGSFGCVGFDETRRGIWKYGLELCACHLSLSGM